MSAGTRRRTALVAGAVAFNLLMYVWATADMLPWSSGSLLTQYRELLSDEIAVPLSVWTALVQLPAHVVAIALVMALYELGVERTSLLGIAVPQTAYLLVSSIQTVGMVFGVVVLGRRVARRALRRR